MKEIEQVIDSLERAIGDRNPDAVIALFGPDNVMMTLNAPLRVASKDPGEGKAAMQKWFDTWDGRITITHRDLVVKVSGDIAFAHMLCHMTGARKQGGPTDLWYRETYGLQKLDGAWKIIHEH